MKERIEELRACHRKITSVVNFDEAVNSRRQSAVVEMPFRSQERSATGGQSQSGMQQVPLALNEIPFEPATETKVAIVQIGSKVVVEKVADGRKMSFVLSKDRNDPDNGIVATYTPLGEALLEAEEGEKVSYEDQRQECRASPPARSRACAPSRRYLPHRAR